MSGPSSWLYQASLKWPGKEAVFDEEVSLTFAALSGDAMQTAQWLRSEGKGGDRVVIALPSGVPSTVLYFATHFAGMVAVPLDPALEPRLFDLIVEEADPVLVVVSSDSKNATRGRKVRILRSYRDLQRAVRNFPRAADLPVSSDEPSRLVNIVYTSGTTGRPKGVMLTEGNLEAVTRGIRKAVAIGEHNRMFTALSFAHTYGLSQLWLMAREGAALGVVADITRMALIKSVIVERGVDVIAGVPYHFALLTRRGHKEKWKGIKVVTVAGDAPSTSLIKRMKLAFPKADIFVMYGLTEASTRLTVLPSSDLEKKAGSMGLPIEGVELKVIDEKGNELGPNQEGELIARGSNVSPGYWKNEDMTQRTITNGWLHTGDLVKKDVDGYFYHLGRRDLVFKSGGEKVIPEAIEKALLEIEGIREAAVIGRDDVSLGKSICAVVVKEEGSRLTRAAVIAACQGKLHRLWVPHDVVFVEKIPKTSHGKTRYH